MYLNLNGTNVTRFVTNYNVDEQPMPIIASYKMAGGNRVNVHDPYSNTIVTATISGMRVTDPEWSIFKNVINRELPHDFYTPFTDSVQSFVPMTVLIDSPISIKRNGLIEPFDIILQRNDTH